MGQGQRHPVVAETEPAIEARRSLAGPDDEQFHPFIQRDLAHRSDHARADPTIEPGGPPARPKLAGPLAREHGGWGYPGELLRSARLAQSWDRLSRDRCGARGHLNEGMELFVVWPDERAASFYRRLGFGNDGVPLAPAHEG